MLILWIVLNREESLDDILSAMIELEITGATILDGVGMKRVLAKDVPIFAGLLQSMSGSRPYNKNIIAAVKDRETIFELLDLLKEFGINFDKPGTGKLLAFNADISVSEEGIWQRR